MSSLRDMPPSKFWTSPVIVPFVAAIRANPVDNLCREVFADYLEGDIGGEVDTEHAHFIRRSIALAQDPKAFDLLAGQSLKLVNRVTYRVFKAHQTALRRGERNYAPLTVRQQYTGTGYPELREVGRLYVHRGFLSVARYDAQGGELLAVTGILDSLARYHPIFRFTNRAGSDRFPGVFRVVAGRLFEVEVNFLGTNYVFDEEEIAEIVGRRNWWPPEGAGIAVLEEVLTRHANPPAIPDQLRTIIDRRTAGSLAAQYSCLPSTNPHPSNWIESLNRYWPRRRLERHYAGDLAARGFTDKIALEPAE